MATLLGTLYSDYCEGRWDGSSLESGDYLLNLEGIAEFHQIDNR